MRAPKRPIPKSARSLVRPVFFYCVTLIVIFTLCLYGLGLVGVYLRWFILEAPLPDTPTPLVVTVIMPSEPGTVEPIVITVVITRQAEGRAPTRTLAPTPTQWWPTPAAAEPGWAPLSTGAPPTAVPYGPPPSARTVESQFGSAGQTATLAPRPTSTDTSTPTPPATATAAPTAAPRPSATSAPPTDTPLPPTATVPMPVPTDTSAPTATDTPVVETPGASPLETPLNLIPPQLD